MGADLPAIGIVLPLGAQCELSLAAPAALFLVRWRWTARSVTRGDNDKDHVTSELDAQPRLAVDDTMDSLPPHAAGPAYREKRVAVGVRTRPVSDLPRRKEERP